MHENVLFNKNNYFVNGTGSFNSNGFVVIANFGCVSPIFVVSTTRIAFMLITNAFTFNILRFIFIIDMLFMCHL